MKVVDEELDQFKKWSFPLPITNEVPQKGERIFMASFPDPYYRPDYKKKILEHWRTLPQQGEKILKSNREVTLFDGGFIITTGVFTSTFAGRLRSAKVTDENNNYEQQYQDPDTSAIDSGFGSSGGPWLNSKGEVFGVYTETSGRPEGKNVGHSENTQVDLHLAVSISDSNLSAIRSLKQNYLEMGSRKIALKKRMKEISVALEDEAKRLKSHTSEVLGHILAKQLKNTYHYKSYGVKNPNDSFWKRSKPIYSPVFCSTMAPLEKSIFKIYEIEIQIINSGTTKIRYRVPYLFDLPKKNWIQSIFSFSSGSDVEAGWSPSFTIPTAFLLGNVRYIPSFERRIKNKRAEGFSWLLYQDSAFDYVERSYFFSIFLNEILNGVLQDFPGLLESDPYAWSIVQCTDEVKQFFSHGVKWFDFEWIKESTKQWQEYDSANGLFR